MTARLAWPLALRIPLLVAGLMVAVALAVSTSVLSRLARDQERHLGALAGTYLDGLETAIRPAATRADMWEAFDALDRARSRYGGLQPVRSAVLRPDGAVLAAADPRDLPTGAWLPAAFGTAADQAARGAPVLDLARARAVLARDLVEGTVPIGRIVAEVDISGLLAERAEVRRTLLIANTLLTAGLTAFGFLLVRRLLRPIEFLRHHVAAGDVAPIPPERVHRHGSEFAALFTAWNRTAAAVAEREAFAARLAAEERYAMLGKLASGMAHEVNNPLGGLYTAVDTLAEHGASPAVRAEALGFLRRGLDDIRNVVRAMLVTYKGAAGDGRLRRDDLNDLRHLVRQPLALRTLTLDWHNELPAESPVDRTMARQIALNLLLNAAAASPVNATLRLDARGAACGGITLDIADAGPGLPAAMEALLAAPEAPPEGGGLGLWTAARLARAAGGRIERLPAGMGTTLRLVLPPIPDAAHAAG